MPSIPQIFFFGIVYGLAMAGVVLLRRREFKESPEKGRRYKALPNRFKFACSFCVIPVFAGIFLEPALFLPAIIAFMLLEAACVRWYQKAGLLP